MRDLHELYAMSEKSEGPAEKNSTTIAASIGAGPISPTVVGIDDGDTGDGLVLGRRRRGWMGDGGGYGGSGGGGQKRAAAVA